MQRISALALAACGALLGALSVTPVPAVALASAPAADCPAGVGDLEVNKWMGPPVGAWNEDENWSLGKYPGSQATNQVVCIRADQVWMNKDSRLRVHVAAIDIGDAGELVVQSSNWLFVEADPHQLASNVATGSSVEVQGGVLGGHGRVELHGHLVLSADEGPALLTTRPCARHCTKRLPAEEWGTISVEGDGLFLVRSPVRVTDSYHVVVVGGELRMKRSHGHVTADRGTRLALRPDQGGLKPPRLTFRNDGGWFASQKKTLHLDLTRVLIHGGVVSKRSGGISSVQGKVSTTDDLNATITRGTLAVMGADPKLVHTDLSGGSYSTGACLPDVDDNGCIPVATKRDRQIASVRLPQDAEAKDLTVTEDVSKKGSSGKATDALGRATVFEAGDLSGVSSDDPMVIELRYDAKIAAGYSPLTTTVQVAESNGDYVDVPPCVSGQIPVGGACVDRGLSHNEADGDLVMVVRTLHFSRYECR